MPTIREEEIVVRILVAAVLGGLIGLERELHGRAAGLRTHILVAMGSALIMLVSIHGFRDLLGTSQGAAYDPGRLAAQVVSGIGFLGAGTILREGASIRGLTTAASLWVVAGIGLGTGAGFYFGSAITTAFSWMVLNVLNRLEQRFLRDPTTGIRVHMRDEPGMLGEIASSLGDIGVDIRSITLAADGSGTGVLDMRLSLPPGVTKVQVIERVRALQGVEIVEDRT